MTETVLSTAFATYTVSVVSSTATPRGTFPTVIVGDVRAQPDTLLLLHVARFTTDTVLSFELATYNVRVR
jgi:hypothetical protein